MLNSCCKFVRTGTNAPPREFARSKHIEVERVIVPHRLMMAGTRRWPSEPDFAIIQLKDTFESPTFMPFGYIPAVAAFDSHDTYKAAIAGLTPAFTIGYPNPDDNTNNLKENGVPKDDRVLNQWISPVSLTVDSDHHGLLLLRSTPHRSRMYVYARNACSVTGIARTLRLEDSRAVPWWSAWTTST